MLLYMNILLAAMFGYSCWSNFNRGSVPSSVSGEVVRKEHPLRFWISVAVPGLTSIANAVLAATSLT